MCELERDRKLEERSHNLYFNVLGHTYSYRTGMLMISVVGFVCIYTCHMSTFAFAHMYVISITELHDYHFS